MMTRYLPEDLRPWVDARFSRASGPGGQHVNKVETRVTVLFDFENCDLLSDWHKSRIRERLRTRMSSDGRVHVTRGADRSQRANRETAEAALAELINTAFQRKKTRIATKPGRAAKERRLRAKKQRGDTKRLRRAPPD
ncbi:MAG: aminoacyl-tRNA hydrolase [Phycisphaerales bacterium]|nr:aminoacyl-tRNA hydrolase [Phycisphaerales bacterium]